MDEIWRWIGQTNPDTWAAGAGWTTTVVAIVASVAAFWQVREARDLRREQAQPYVIAYMETSPASEHLMDLVIKNVGTTPARDVTVVSVPPLVRTSLADTEWENLEIPAVLPMLVPGQEWRSYWDSGIERKDKGLPDRYEITATYKDSRNRVMEPTIAILDWASYKSRVFARVYGVHDATTALRRIDKTLTKLSQHGLTVFTKDGKAVDAARREAHAQTVRRLHTLGLVPTQNASSPSAPQAEDIEPGESDEA
ncbi:hypothetical protein [Micromonospora sp. NPDC050276]|uniref:hypothetical protein n=1 Tax=Micromonospora sp. NPDC050276 TaxID=3364278 RepID=UPI0037932864